MTIQPLRNSLDTIMQRIDAMIDELYALRKTVQALDPKKGEIEQTLQEEPSKRSVLDILADAPAITQFQSARSVEQYIAEERSSWDS